MKKSIFNFLLIVAGFSLVIFLIFYRHAYHFFGYTMGTTYKVVIYERFIHADKLRDIKLIVEKELEDLNKIFSTFDENSEICRANNFDKNIFFSVNDDLAKVLNLSKEIYLLTDGYFDPTIDPLVRVWGFGRENVKHYPSKQDIDLLVRTIGYDKFVVNGKYLLKKQNMQLDLASVAKGYATDKIVEILEEEGFKNFLVEIGGELYVKGDEFYKTGWDVTIINPLKEDEGLVTLRLKDKGVATSGSYRNYRVYDKKKYQHIINPKTGYPIFSDLVSVTVVAENVAFADALATGIMVMGVEKGMKLINNLQDVEAVFIEIKNKKLVLTKSKGLL